MKEQPLQWRALARQSLCRLLAGSVLAAAGGALAAELSAEERLQAVRHGLAQQAMQGATQVRTTSWIDAQGALRESSSFRSGMQVRGVRVIGYSRDAQGQPQAQVQVQGPQDLVKAESAAKAASHAATCSNQDRLRHVMALELQVRGRWTVDEEHLRSDLAQLLVRSWREAPAWGPRWQLVELPGPVNQASTATSAAYERVLTGGAATSPALAWRLLLSMETVPAAPPSVVGQWLPWTPAAPTTARLSLSLQSSREPAPVLLKVVELPLLAQERSWSPPRLQQASIRLAQALMHDWAQAVTERMACEPVQVRVLHAAGDRLQIDQGALAGVKAGDEWLVSDRRHWPARVLESDAPMSLVLARVERVSAHQAQLQVLAGPSSAVKPQWQAWPMEPH